jgi:cell division protein FtsW
MIAMLSNRDQLVSPAYDQALIWVTLLLLCFGLVMVYSSSIALAEADQATGYQSTYFLLRHAVYVVLALLAALLAFQIPVARWQRLSPYLFVAGIILLVLVLIPGIGREVNGSRRWINLYVANLQPSELMKLFAAMYVADYTVRKAAFLDSFTKGFLPMLIVMLLVAGLLLLEPDFGAFAVVAAIAISILWLGGINGKILCCCIYGISF